jgi:hypothetical protein
MPLLFYFKFIYLQCLTTKLIELWSSTVSEHLSIELRELISVCLRLATHTVTSVVRRSYDSCRIQVVEWKLRLHFIFYYLMRHESHGRRTTDVVVCVASLTRSFNAIAILAVSRSFSYSQVLTKEWDCSIGGSFTLLHMKSLHPVSSISQVAVPQ